MDSGLSATSSYSIVHFPGGWDKFLSIHMEIKCGCGLFLTHFIWHHTFVLKMKNHTKTIIHTHTLYNDSANISRVKKKQNERDSDFELRTNWLDCVYKHIIDEKNE